VNARVYLNTTTLAFGDRIDGGSFNPPSVRAYSDIIFRFRLSRDIEGVSVPDDRELTSVAARIGWPDRAPADGSYQLEISVGGDSVTTAAIAHDATAAVLQGIINDALTAGETPPLDHLAPCRVSLYQGAYRIAFADQAETVEIAAADNELWPLSFIEADRISWDGGNAHILTLRQTPVAETASAAEVVPPLPAITRLQAGATTDGIAINEVQKIALSPAYAGGSFRILRSGVKSSILPGFPSVEQLQEALDELADDGGTFFLIPVEDGVFVEFRGIMGGEAQDLMTVEEFAPPPVEYLVALDTRTAAMRTLMSGADSSGEIEVPLDIQVTVTDNDAPDDEQVMHFPLALTFTKPVSDDARNVSAELDWTQPLARRDNLPFSPNALLIGNRAKRFVIGDGVATSFVLNHNLGAAAATFSANATTDVLTAVGHNYHNGDPLTLSSTTTLPAPLAEGVTYWVIAATDDTFKLAQTPGGGAINITTTGTGTHTASLADGTADGVDVSVWQVAGDRLRLSPSTYTVARTTADSLTLSGFAATPTSGQYAVLVQSYGRPATYQSHIHTLDESPETKARIEAIEARLLALENGSVPGTAPVAARLGGAGILRLLPPVWRVLRTRTQPEQPESLLGWDPYYTGSPLRDIRLLPAVHLASGSIEALPAVLPAAAAVYRNRVFYSATDREDFPGGALYTGQYAACDGRDWYRVARESTSETTWYPTLFDLELWRLSVSPDELALRSTLELAFGIEVALYAPRRRPAERRTVARAALILERGVRVSDTSPATTGENIDTHFGSPVVIGSHVFDLTEVPAARRMALTVSRSGADTFTATVAKMQTAFAPVSAPASADFVLRARLARFDVEDLPLDGRGIVAVRGLDVGLDGKPDINLGRITIS
jgi:hypothetical protein